MWPGASDFDKRMMQTAEVRRVGEDSSQNSVGRPEPDRSRIAIGNESGIGPTKPSVRSTVKVRGLAGWP